jgi:hypothetical protein
MSDVIPFPIMKPAVDRSPVEIPFPLDTVEHVRRAFSWMRTHTELGLRSLDTAAEQGVDDATIIEGSRQIVEALALFLANMP